MTNISDLGHLRQTSQPARALAPPPQDRAPARMHARGPAPLAPPASPHPCGGGAAAAAAAWGGQRRRPAARAGRTRQRRGGGGGGGAAPRRPWARGWTLCCLLARRAGVQQTEGVKGWGGGSRVGGCVGWQRGKGERRDARARVSGGGGGARGGACPPARPPARSLAALDVSLSPVGCGWARQPALGGGTCRCAQTRS